MFEVTSNNINLIVEDERVGYILYDEADDFLVGSHIYVNPEERGNGYAGKLIEYLVQFAKEKNRKIMPTCPVIKRTLETNYPEILR